MELANTQDGVRGAGTPASEQPADFHARKIDFKHSPWPWAVALLVLTLGAYITGFKGVFVYDDIPMMLKNPLIRDWSRLDQIFGAIQGRPVVSLSLAVDYAIYGSQPFGYHFVNLAAHAIGALALFGIARRTFRAAPSPASTPGSNDLATPLAFSAALLWAIHPLHTEAVTYIIQRCESLMGMFFLLSLYCVVRGAESERKTAWHAAAIAAAALSAGCKQTAAVLPLVVLLYDRCFISGSFAAAIKRAPALLGGLLVSWAVIVLSLVLSPAKVTSAGFAMQGLTPFTYARSQCVVIVHYLRLALLPAGQCFDYAWPIETDNARIVPCAALIAILLGLCVWRLILNRPSGFWGAFFFLALAPASSVLPIADLACERRMYLPLAALTPLAIMALLAIQNRCFSARNDPAPDGMAPGSTHWLSHEMSVPFIAVLLALALGCMTALRNTLYWDSQIIWIDAEEKSPLNSHAWQTVGNLKLKNGDTAGAKLHLKRALEIKPDFPDALGTLGTAQLVEKNYSEAIGLFRQALALDPKHAPSLYGLTEALRGAGRIGEALESARHAVELQPGDAQIQAQFGSELFKAGRIQDAIRAYSAALHNDPYTAGIHNGLGGILATAGRMPEALAEFEAALKLKPGDADAWYNRGNALEIMGKIPDAVNSYAAALKANPEMAPAANALAWILSTSPAAEIRDGKAAVQFAEKACGLTGGENALMLDTLAAAYAESGQFDKAASAAENALQRAAPNSPFAREIRTHLILFKAGKPIRTGPKQ